MEKTETSHKEYHNLAQEEPVSVVNEKHIRLRYNLEKAIASREIDQLEPAIKEVKEESVPGISDLLKKVEDLDK